MNLEKECKICKKKFIHNKYSHNQIYCCKKCCRKAYYYSTKGQIEYKERQKRIKHRYNKDKKFRERRLQTTSKYVTSQKGRVTKSKNRKRYRKTEKGKLADLKYGKSKKRKVSSSSYNKSKKGKINSFKGAIKRRSRLKNINHHFSFDDWIQKVKNTFGVCPKCNTYIGINKLTLDHIIPISKAEVNQVYTINDVQPLCLRCNVSKNNRIIN